jgi:prepilin-type processing-associated H-X9-DG protein
MEPTDILQEHAYLGVNQHEFGIGSEHSGGVMTGFADGSVRFMREAIPPNILRALLTRAGGEAVSASPYVEFMR